MICYGNVPNAGCDISNLCHHELCHGKWCKISCLNLDKPVSSRISAIFLLESWLQRGLGRLTIRLADSMDTCMMTKWNPDNPADLGIWDDLGWMQPLPERKAKKCLKLTKKKNVSEGGENSVTENSCFVRA